MLGRAKHKPDERRTQRIPGVVQGLAWTPVGGASGLGPSPDRTRRSPPRASRRRRSATRRPRRVPARSARTALPRIRGRWRRAGTRTQPCDRARRRSKQRSPAAPRVAVRATRPCDPPGTTVARARRRCPNSRRPRCTRLSANSLRSADRRRVRKQMRRGAQPNPTASSPAMRCFLAGSDLPLSGPPPWKLSTSASATAMRELTPRRCMVMP